jgi:predicted nuclease of predicted toxin-antitoxin system
MRLVVDMNLTPDWVRFFESAGIAAQHWSSLGHPAASDDDVLSFARERGDVVFTSDLDFGALLAKAGARGPSVVMLRTQDVMPAAIGSQMVALLGELRDELEAGALVVVEPAGRRVRVLPLRSRSR